MSGFIEWLEKTNENDSKVRAILRRSLAFYPGDFVPAYPYVEPFLKGEENLRRRETFYLVAAVWAAHWREGRENGTQSIGQACANHQNTSGSASTERRFINLLDADYDQLPQRLRQIIALLDEYPIDFNDLLRGLLGWGKEKKPTQQKWAKEFYIHLKDSSVPEENTDKEDEE